MNHRETPPELKTITNWTAETTAFLSTFRVEDYCYMPLEVKKNLYQVLYYLRKQSGMKFSVRSSGKSIGMETCLRVIRER
jgi:hypothetical protein